VALVRQSPDNYRAHSGLQAALLKLDPPTAQRVFELKRLEMPTTVLVLGRDQLLSLRNFYKRLNISSKSIGKIILSMYQYNASSFTGGEEDSDDAEFEAVFDVHLRRCLRDGLPALYHDVCSLIKIPSELKSISSTPQYVYAKEPFDVKNHPITQLTLKLVGQYIQNLKAYEQFDKPASPQELSQGDDVIVLNDKGEAPTALLWALYLKCHMLELCGNLNEALSVIEEVIICSLKC
jgi:hypothetical protein